MSGTSIRTGGSLPYTYVDLFAYYEVWPGDLLIYDEEVINESIRNILTVQTGTLIFNRRFGCDLLKLLFEMINDDTAQKIYMTTVYNIQQNEPRVTVIPSGTSVVPEPDANRYNLNITYRIKATGKTHTFGFRLKALR